MSDSGIDGRRGGRELLVLVLGTADWNSPIATNQHYVTRELSREYRCLFSEGTGTRRPRLTRDDLARIARRVMPTRSSSGPSRPVPPSARVTSPRLVPGHGPLTDAVNRPALRRQLRAWLEHDGARLLWTFTPYTYGLEQHATRTVYHLVDLLHENPGVDSRRLLEAERALARTADVAVGTSAAIASHLLDQGFRRVLEKPNVADTEVFASAAARVSADGDATPSVVFTGALSPHKVDFPLLLELARAIRGQARLRLIGPRVQGVGADTALTALSDAGASIEGPLTLAELSSEVAGATVGVVPYQVNELTRGITPLKMYEFLAAGVPVVATSIPSISSVERCIWVESTTEAFVERVRTLLRTGSAEDKTHRQTVARSHDWSGRGEELRSLTADLLAAATD